jgi:hypothetical protein
VLIVAGFAAGDRELLIRDARLIDEIEPLIPQFKPIL